MTLEHLFPPINQILKSNKKKGLSTSYWHFRGDRAPWQLSVGLMCSGKRDGAEYGARAGRQESSAGASLTHVGQSSVEIRLMNRGERAKRRGYSSFNIPPSLSVGPALVCPPLEEGEAAKVSGWHIRTSEKDFWTREPRDKAPATDASCLISIENPWI